MELVLQRSACLLQVQPALRATTSASPRLHTLWSHLLPFLLPGFLPHKVGYCNAQLFMEGWEGCWFFAVPCLPWFWCLFPVPLMSTYASAG